MSLYDCHCQPVALIRNSQKYNYYGDWQDAGATSGPDPTNAHAPSKKFCWIWVSQNFHVASVFCSSKCCSSSIYPQQIFATQARDDQIDNFPSFDFHFGNATFVWRAKGYMLLGAQKRYRKIHGVDGILSQQRLKLKFLNCCHTF